MKGAQTKSLSKKDLSKLIIENTGVKTAQDIQLLSFVIKFYLFLTI